MTDDVMTEQPLKVVLIDNRDSFTFNLVDELNPVNLLSGIRTASQY